MEIVFSKPNPKRPYHSRAPASSGFRAISGNHLSPQLNPRDDKGKETGSRKTISFVDLNEENPLGCGQDQSAEEKEQTRTGISNAPKTSEYAFFKKLKETRVQRINASQHKEVMQTKKSISFDNANASTNMDNSGYKESAQPMLKQDVTPNNLASFLYSVDCTPKKSGSFCKTNEVLQKKRENLFSWVRTTSFPEIDKLCLNGFGLVPALLSRLYPKNNENNDSMHLNARQHKSDMSPLHLNAAQLRSDTSSKMVAFSESGIHSKGLYQRPKREFLEMEDWQCSEFPVSCRWLSAPMDRIISDFDAPAAPALKTITWQEFEVYFQDEFQTPSKYLIEGRTGDLELKWFPDVKKNGGQLSLTSQSREPYTHPLLLTNGCKDHEQTLDSGSDARKLSVASLHPQQHFQSESLSISFDDDDLETVVHQDERGANTYLAYFPIYLPHPSDHFHMAEDHSYDAQYKALSPPEHDWLISKYFWQRHSHPPMDGSACSLSDDSESGWMCSLSPPEQDWLISKYSRQIHPHPTTDNSASSLRYDPESGWIHFPSPSVSRANFMFTDYTNEFSQDGELFWSSSSGEGCHKWLDGSIHPYVPKWRS